MSTENLPVSQTSVHWFHFSAHQFLKISVSVNTDFQKLVSNEYWLVNQISPKAIYVSSSWNFTHIWSVINLQRTPVCFQWTPVSENQCEQIHLFLKTSVTIQCARAEMRSVYTDLISWLIFSGYQFVFSGHQFLKIIVNRYTGLLSANHTSSL